MPEEQPTMADCFHLILKGDESNTRGFIEGLIVGADAYGSIYFIDGIRKLDPLVQRAYQPEG